MGNETQARGVQESAYAMEEMAAGIQRIASTSSTACDASLTTLRQAEEGNELIVKSSEQMNAVSSKVGDLASIVDKLGERSQQIGEIVQAITDISSQTNLPALNASIKAARAGEQGKGFAVVAGEVKKLAERSNESAAQVAELIESIRGDIERATVAMEQGEREVAAGVEAIRLTGEAFRHILDATRSVVDQVQSASAAAEQMSASSQEVAASLQEMERTSARANEMTEMQSLAHRFKL